MPDPKHLILYLLSLLFPMFASAQNFGFDWAKTIGDQYTDEANDIVVDAAGNSYMTGIALGYADFDPGAGTSTIAGNLSVFVLKLDPQGNFVWVRGLGGVSNSDNGKSIQLDASGNVYVAGVFAGTGDFDPGSGTATLTTDSNLDEDGFLVKLDNNGDFVWAKQFKGPGIFNIRDLKVDAAGSSFMTGEFDQVTDFDPGPGVQNIDGTLLDGAFIVKLDTDGNLAWVKTIAGYSCGEGMNLGTGGNVVVVGHFSGTHDFNPGTGTAQMTSAGSRDMFVLKLDGSGNYIWSQKMGGTAYDAATSVVCNPAGEIFVSGQFNGTADFDPGAGVTSLISNGSQDIAVFKLDQNGSLLWAKSVGGPDHYDEINDIILDAAGDVYCIGVFADNVDFDPGSGVVMLTCNATEYDGYLLKLTGNGDFVFVKQFVGVKWMEVNGVALTSSGHLSLAGWFVKKTDFDPGPATYYLENSTQAGQDFQDIFVVRFKPCFPTSSTLITSSCGSFTLGSNTFDQSGHYDVVLTNAQGCDSLVALDLTIVPESDSLIQVTACDAYTLNGQTYATSGTYLQVLPNAVGCDSTITLQLQITPTTASTVTAAACQTYSLNGQTYTLSGTYTQLLTNVAGCDSTLTLHLQIDQPTSQTIAVVACDHYTLNGQTYTASGNYVQTLTSMGGCDSTIYLQLQIKASTSSVTTTTSCDSYTLNGQTYTASGTYTQVLPNVAGCDSTITLQLQINQSTSSTVAATACETYTLNGQTYTVSGTYTQLLTNAAGCDSILTLQLQINQVSSSTMTVVTCEDYTLNGQTYTSSGTYTQLLTNVAGCDSSITLLLTVNEPELNPAVVQSGSMLSALETNATYQWINCDGNVPIGGATSQQFTVIQTGSYAVQLTSTICSDVVSTSACFDVDLTGIEEYTGTKPVIYPNPAVKEIHIASEVALQQVSLRDLNGKIITSVAFEEVNGLVTLDLHTISAGIYLIEVLTKNGSYTERIVVEN